MHLRNVEIFCDVVARRSFSRAAEAHHVSQPSASQAVHVLEERLGTQLIDRSKRPLELTAAGEIYFDGSRKLLDSFHRLEDRVRQVENNKVAGRLRVANHRRRRRINRPKGTTLLVAMSITDRRCPTPMQSLATAD